MKRMAFVVWGCVAWVGCKGSAATTEAAAPSASATDPATATVAASATPSVTATASAAPSATQTSGILGSLRTPPPGACKCAHISVGGIYPHQSGHAMQFHDQDAKVISVDPSTCTATLKDVAKGTSRTERCDSSFFDEPRINPAG